MGKRHNTLDYKYFHKTKYIKTLEQEKNITNFKKEYFEQFNIIYDIFKTLINANNIVFADSNKTIDDKVFELNIELEKCLYGDKDNDSNSYKYSVRTINNLPTIEPKRLYKSFIEWYEYLESMEKLGTIPKEIEEIMSELENLGFDDVINENVAYKENKNSKQRLFLSRFFKYNCDEKYLSNFIDDYYKKYVETLSRDEIKKEICFIFDLVAKANNGIVRKMNNIKDILSKKDFYHYDYILDYFETLNIQVKDDDNFSTLKEEFTKEEAIIGFYLSLYDIENFSIEDITSGKDILCNFDLYSFVVCMYQITNGLLVLETKNQMLLKIVEDLKKVYNNILNNDYELAHKQVLEIISNNSNIFIKIS